MWSEYSETVGLIRQDRSQTKQIGLGVGLSLARCGLGLAGLMLCCETRSCYARRHNHEYKHGG